MEHSLAKGGDYVGGIAEPREAIQDHELIVDRSETKPEARKVSDDRSNSDDHVGSPAQDQLGPKSK
jgi:hypothetical protein